MSALTSSIGVTTSRTVLPQQLQRPALQRCHMAKRQHMRVRAEGGQPPVKPPQGVTQPPVQPTVQPALFGFVDNAERINSRAAMLGFFGILLVEAIANKGVLEMAGFTVGNGLGFEF